MPLSTQSPPLRFAVMLQGKTLKKWQFETIRSLVESRIAEPVLCIYNDCFLTEETAHIKKIPFLFRIYEKLFLRTKALANVELNDSLTGLPSLHCIVSKKGKFSEYFSSEDIRLIQNHEPDFIVRFGFGIIRGEILNCTRFGVWSFHHSDEQVIRGGPAGFWEVFRKQNISGAILQRLTEQLDGGILLKKRFYKTVLHDLQFHINKVLLDSAEMPVQVCRDILFGQADYFQDSPIASKAPVYSYPSALMMVLFFLKQTYRRIQNFTHEVFVHERWAVGISDNSFYEIIDSGKVSCTNWFEAKSRSHYLADPFSCQSDGQTYLFYEKYRYLTGKAVVERSMLSSNNKLIDYKTLPFELFHYSFPFIVKYNETCYILPEQIEKKGTELYEYSIEDNSFKKTTKLLPAFELVDPVLFEYENIWWLFGTLPGQFSNEKLMLFFSSSPDGSFTEHPANPVKVTPVGARMAGSLRKSEGKLLRFGQDSSEYYGKRIAVFEIQELSVTSYKEIFVKFIEPASDNRFSKGLHTISELSDKVLIDGKIHTLSFSGTLFRLKQKILRRSKVC